MKKAKPFEISKWVVVEAWKQVKANQGAAGVDQESIADFERDLEEQSLQDLESNVIGKLPSPAGQDGSDTEEDRWGKDAWDSYRGRQSGADGCQAVL